MVFMLATCVMLYLMKSIDKVLGNTYGFEDGAYKDQNYGLEFAMVSPAGGMGIILERRQIILRCGNHLVSVLQHQYKSQLKTQVRLVYGYSGQITSLQECSIVLLW